MCPLVQAKSLILCVCAAPECDNPRTAARAAMARAAAAFLVAGNPLNMFLVDQDALEVDGAPIIDGLAAVVKTAEMLVDLKAVGIERSRTGLFVAPNDEEFYKLRDAFS